jgi:hypothetical protein
MKMVSVIFISTVVPMVNCEKDVEKLIQSIPLCILVHNRFSVSFIAQGLSQFTFQFIESDSFVSFDPNYRHPLPRDNTESLFFSFGISTALSFLCMSDEEATALTHKSTVEEAAAYFLENTTAVLPLR